MMRTEKELVALSTLLAEVSFEHSSEAYEIRHQDLVAEYDRICAKLCDTLDDKRTELFRKVLDLRDEIEFDHNLHYLKQGLIRGTSLADRTEISDIQLTFS